MKLPLTVAIAAALTVCAAPQARATCDSAVDEVVRVTSATIDHHTLTVFTLKHPAADFLLVDCGPIEPKDREVLDIGVYTKHPKQDFWLLVGAAGAAVAGGPPREIQFGAQDCFKASRTDRLGDGKIIRDGVIFICGWTQASREGTFSLHISRTGGDLE